MQPNFGNNLQDEETLLSEAALQQGVIDKPQQAAKTSNVLKQYEKRVWIVLEDNDQIPPTGQFIGHDGVGFMLRPNLPAEVPVELLDILNNAIYSAAEVDQVTKQIIGYTERLRFPYRLVQAPKEKAA